MTSRARLSAGLLLYRRAPGADGEHGEAAVEVLLVHPGGPYWARRDAGWWSIPKGEVDPGEDPLTAAGREFAEELGHAAPGAQAVPLGEVVQAGGKRVVAWAVEGDLDPETVTSGTFEMEWPPRSGVRRTFPEVDRAAWCTPEEARRRILPGQLPLLDRLAEVLGRPGGPLGRDGSAPAR